MTSWKGGRRHFPASLVLLEFNGFLLDMTKARKQTGNEQRMWRTITDNGLKKIAGKLRYHHRETNKVKDARKMPEPMKNSNFK